MTEKQAETKDPKLKRLRKDKDQWNSKVQLLIAKLIAFKRGLNGSGDQDAHLPEINIQSAFPLEYSVYLDSIADDYKNIVDGAQSIIDYQDTASRKSRRRQNFNRLSFMTDDILKAEASWWGSRMWASLGLRGLPTEERKLRLRMIASANEARKYLNDLEVIITGRAEDKLPRAAESLVDFGNMFLDTFVQDLKDLKFEEGKRVQMMPQLPPAAPEGMMVVPEEGGEEVYNESPPAPNMQNPEAEDQALWDEMSLELHGPINQKLLRVQLSGLKKGIRKSIQIWHDNFEEKFSDSNKQHPEIFRRELTALHNRLIELNKELDKSASLLIDDDIKKVAGQAVRRWIQRSLMKLDPSMLNQMLEKIVDDLLSLNPMLNNLMDVLENKSVTVESSENLSRAILKTLKSAVNRLHYLSNNHYRSKKKPGIAAKTLSGLNSISGRLENIINPPELK